MNSSNSPDSALGAANVPDVAAAISTDARAWPTSPTLGQSARVTVETASSAVAQSDRAKASARFLQVVDAAKRSVETAFALY